MPGRIERWLLRAYPPDFRARHADELRAFWASQAGEARYRGPVGRLRLLAAIGPDAIASGIRMRWNEGGGMKGIWMDVVYARRSLGGAPLFTALAVLTVGLGIGAVTSVFGVVEGVLLRPLPYPEPDRIVMVLRTDAEGESTEVSWPDLADWMEQAEGFDGLAGYAESEESFEWADGAESVIGARVTRNYFEVMGVPLLLGRTFTPEEDAFGGPRGIVLSHALWRTRFDADPDVVGSTVPLSSGAVPIVGVAAEGFAAPFEATRFWVPLQGDQLLADVGLPTGRRSLSFIDAVGRLGPGVDPAAAGEALRGLARRIDEEAGKGPEQMSNVSLQPLHDWVAGDVGRTLALLLAAAGLVLVVATANVAGLSISRGRARGREIAVRRALGASRSRLVRQLVTEGLVLAGAAGVLGLALAWGAQAALLRLAPPGLPRAGTIEIGATTAAFALLASLASGICFGLVPSIGASRTASGLSGARGSSPERSVLRSQRMLVGLQLTIAVVLLTGATLLVDSFVRLTSVDRGFEVESLVVATVAPSEARYPTPEAIDALYRDVLARVRALPGVASASTTYSPPLFGNLFQTSVVAEGVDEDRENRFWAGTVVIGADYFETNGIELTAGREFGPDDRLGAPPVVIVNREMARRLWPGQDPLGKRFSFTGGLRGSADSFDRAFFPSEPMTVVGVAADVRRQRLDEPPGPEYYRPHAQLTWGFQYLLVRTDVDPSTVASALRGAIWEVDASIPVTEVRTMRDQLSTSVAAQRFRTLLLAVFAGLTALLSMVGLYAVMTLAVSRRTREMGIRIALGASRTSIVGRTVREGLGLVGAGALVGVVASLAAGYGLAPFLSSMLFEVDPVSPLAYVFVVAAVALVGLLAAWLPARRAGSVDPVVSLRTE